MNEWRQLRCFAPNLGHSSGHEVSLKAAALSETRGYDGEAPQRKLALALMINDASNRLAGLQKPFDGRPSPLARQGEAELA